MRSVRRAPRTSLWPFVARWRAVVSPIPLLAPVISTTLPEWLLLNSSLVAPHGLSLGGLSRWCNHAMREQPDVTSILQESYTILQTGLRSEGTRWRIGYSLVAGTALNIRGFSWHAP